MRYGVAALVAVLGLTSYLVVHRTGAPPLQPLTAERYVAVQIALKESLADCTDEERQLTKRFATDRARLGRELASAAAAHREREARIFARAATTARSYEDFVLVPANVAATRKLLEAKPDLKLTLASLEKRRQQ